MTPLVDGKNIDPNQIGEGDLTSEERVYKENILDHYRKPRNKRIIENAMHARDKNPLCGDELEVYIVVEDGTVTDLSFQGKGCAISQATMSMITRKLKEKSVEEINELGQEFVLALLGIPIGIVRRKCAMLGLRVVQQAIGGEK